MNGRVVAVTGATGFLGRHLLERLNANGWRARVLARDPAAAFAASGPAPELVTGALEDNAALSRLVAGADAVIHAAGLIKARTRADFFAVNAEGSRRLAVAATGRRFIHVSSVAAREPQLSDYAASKRAGEDAVRAVAGSSVTTVRPPAIYGPGDKETLALFKGVQWPIMVAPGSPRARLAVAEVGDVARDIVDLLNGQPSGTTITIGGDRPEGYRWTELIAAAARAVETRPVVVAAAPWLVKAAGAVSELAGRWRGTTPIFGRGKAREALHLDWGVSPAEQGVTATYAYTPLAEGFARTVGWYRTQGWLR